LPLGKTDKDASKLDKLEQFRQKIYTGRLVQHWKSPDDLASKAVLALTRAFSTHPQVGWVRADQIPAQSSLADIINLRDENKKLTSELENIKSSTKPKFDDAVGLEHNFKLNYSFTGEYGQRKGALDLSYRDFLKVSAPALHTPATIYNVTGKLNSDLPERHSVPSRNLSVASTDVQDALLHLVATGHVKMWSSRTVDGKNHVTGYQLTPLGVKAWQEMSYVKASTQPPSA
jgi:hypothetical protein